jgi:FKBP-type peptidyl-prolyl cis-trans isomerase (trigger factor)
MKTRIETKPAGQALLGITAEWPEVAADYEDLLADYARMALPGFRPGKAPRAMIEQQFRQELRDDFTARCGRRLVREALREQNLRARGPIPVIEVRFEPRREFSFTAECVPVPNLELPPYAAVPLTTATDDQRRDELSTWLLEHTVGDVPEAFIWQECQRSGLAEPGSVAWQVAAQRVKLMLILEQIAEAEGIEVSEHDADARIERLAADSGTRPAELRRQLGNDGMDRLRTFLRAEQTLAYLLSLASRSAPAAKP